MNPGRTQDAADALYRLMAAAVRHQPREISLTSVSTLATIERTGPRRMTDLALIEGVTQPTMTALVTTLEKSGLIERRPDPRDRRAVLVALTGAGADYQYSLRQAGAQAFARLIDKLPPAEAEALIAAVPALRHLCDLDSEYRAGAPEPGQGTLPDARSLRHSHPTPTT